VEVPAVIGKSAVTVIGKGALSAADWNAKIRNLNERKSIRSIVLAEGIVEIQNNAFGYLDSLEKIVLPSTLKTINTPMVTGCKTLREINIPKDVKIVLGNGLFGYKILFRSCDKLNDQNGYIIINNCLYTYTDPTGMAPGIRNKSDIGNLTIPENVTEIADYVFYEARMSSLTLPSGLKVIGKNAFEECTFLGEVEIPGSVDTIKPGAFSKCSALKTVKLANGVTTIGAEAFSSCSNLRDIYIPKSVKKIGKEIFGAYDDNADDWSKVTGICVHTQEDSPAVEYMKKYSGVYVLFDYDD
jgi:hypothetical protein